MKIRGLTILLYSYSATNNMVLAQKVTCRPVEQNRKPKHEYMLLESFGIKHKGQNYTTHLQENGCGKTGCRHEGK